VASAAGRYAPVLRPNHGPWPPRLARSVGRSLSVTAPNVGPLFFPQSRSLGIDQGTHSPHVLRKIVYAGVQNTSFASGSENLQILAGLRIPEKQVSMDPNHYEVSEPELLRG
jgi:hypothetical protein